MIWLVSALTAAASAGPDAPVISVYYRRELLQLDERVHVCTWQSIPTRHPSNAARAPISAALASFRGGRGPWIHIDNGGGTIVPLPILAQWSVRAHQLSAAAPTVLNELLWRCPPTQVDRADWSTALEQLPRWERRAILTLWVQYLEVQPNSLLHNAWPRAERCVRRSAECGAVMEYFYAGVPHLGGAGAGAEAVEAGEPSPAP